MASTTRKFDVAAIHFAAMRDRKICLIVVTTTKGEVVHLDISGEGLLALPGRIKDLQARCPEIARWRSTPAP